MSPGMGQARFIDDLRHQVGQLPGVKRIEFFGSVVTPRFRPGKSDLDMVVEGTMPPSVKRQVVILIQDANRRHGLRLGESPYLHPVPFFVTNRLSKALILGMARGFSSGLASRWVYRCKARQQQHPTTLQEFWGGWRPGPRDLRYYVAKLWGYEGTDVNQFKQTFYPEAADELVPEGCIAIGNEHGACMDRGCRWCLVYYDGPRALAWDDYADLPDGPDF